MRLKRLVPAINYDNELVFKMFYEVEKNGVKLFFLNLSLLRVLLRMQRVTFALRNSFQV